MRLGKTTLIHFGSQISKSLAGFFATLAIARFLGPALLGQYAITVALIFWLTVPVSAFGNALNKRISEGRERGSFLSAGIIWNTAIGLGGVLLIFLFSGPVNNYIGSDVANLVALLLVANVGIKTVQGALQGQKKVAHTGVIETIERILRTAFQIGLIIAGYTLGGLVFGHAASLIVATALGGLVFETRPSIPSMEHLRSLGEYAKYSWLGSLKTRAFAWMDTIVLAFFAVQASLIGIYEVAWTLASVLAVISISVKKTLFPELSELAVSDDHSQIHHFLNEGLVVTGIFSIPGLFGAAVIGPRVLKIYRPEFKAGAVILLILIFARLLAAYEAQLLGAINALDRPDIAFRINVVFVGSNLALNLVLVYLYGWHGAAVATATSSGISLLFGYVAVTRLIGRPSIPYAQIAYQIMASLVMVAVVSTVAPLVPGNHYLTVGLALFGAGVYTTVLLLASNRMRQKAWSLV